jgi:hypothetical protein
LVRHAERVRRDAEVPFAVPLTVSAQNHCEIEHPEGPFVPDRPLVVLRPGPGGRAGRRDIRESIHELRNVELTSHSFAVVRAAQLQRWAAGEEYRAILSGDYPRRGDGRPGSTSVDDLRRAGASYYGGVQGRVVTSFAVAPK